MSLKSVLTALADAIRSKTGGASVMTLAEMTDAVNGISTGGIDTSDATATAEDMAEGVTAYVNGEKVTGSLPEGKPTSESNALAEVAIYGTTYIQSKVIAGSDAIVRTGTELITAHPASDFGDAAASDVVAGKTFTSAAGLQVTGTHECAGGVDTSDATATAEDMATGKTAYVGGQKVTGTLPTMGGSTVYADSIKLSGTDELVMTCKPFSEKSIVEATTSFGAKAKLTEFGNATAEDVAAGKTFTSANGFTVAGTHECAGGIDTSDATATAEDMAEGVTAYVNGEKVTGSLPEGKPTSESNALAEVAIYGTTYIQSKVIAGSDAIVRTGTELITAHPASDFGDAAASDVVAGKTFTSAAGLQVTGTHECAGGVELRMLQQQRKIWQKV